MRKLVNYEYSVLESEKNGLLADHVCSIYLCNQKQTESETIPSAFLFQVLGNWSWSSERVLLAILQFSAVTVEQWSHSSHCKNKTFLCGISTEVEYLHSHKRLHNLFPYFFFLFLVNHHILYLDLILQYIYIYIIVLQNKRYL